jgi:molecular chaperone DnaJ
VTKHDYYEILGVERTAGDQEIKSAYRKLALKYHPDRNSGNKDAEEKFKEAAEAYAVLADADKRAAYNRFGHAGVRSPAGGGFDPTIFADFSDILGDIFGFGDIFGGGGRRRGGPQRGTDLRYDLEIGFEESAKGAETAIQIQREESCDTCGGSGAAPGTSPIVCPICQGRGQRRYQQGFFTVAQTCPQCSGSGRVVSRPCASCHGAGRTARERKLTVKIPPGIASGQRLRLYGEGEAGRAGGPPGDLYVFVQVQDHAFFHRESDDLYCEIPVSYPTLALGGRIKVPTLDGPDEVKIPEGTESGTVFRLRGKGMPHVSGHGSGDLHVVVQVKTPRKLTREQRKALEQLAHALPEDTFEPKPQAVAEEDRSVFDRVKDILS